MTKLPPDSSSLSPMVMNLSGQLRFSSEGRWYHDGEEVTHQGFSDYLGRHLKFFPDLGFVVMSGERCVQVEIEDTPYVVRTIDTNDFPWTVMLSDGSCEVIAPETLSCRSDRGFVLRVKGGEFRAALSRSAMQMLLSRIEAGEDGSHVLCYGSERISIIEE